MKRIGTMVGVCLTAAALAACSGGGSTTTPSGSVTGSGAGGSSGGGSGASGGKVVSGGTFTMSLASDPGNLDPQLSAASSVLQISAFAYDQLISIDSAGKLSSALATSWKASGTTARLTIRPGITCSDGTTFSAATAAANINFVGNPKNKSPLLGTYLPPGATATAKGSTLMIKLAAPAPFVLQGLAVLPMVCKAGLANRSMLAHKSDGTGLFKLTQDVASDHLTFTKRSGYTWGAGGVTSTTAGLPGTVVVKFVSNETTAANLLLSGALNAASVIGPDTKRLQAANVFAAKEQTLLGEMWFNHAMKRPGADLAVRKALTQAVDLTQLAKVLSSNEGTPATTFAVAPPVACPGNSISAALPPHGLSKAAATLDAAGWKAGSGGVRSKDGKPLALTFIYDTALGSAGAAAAQLAAATWKQMGADVTMRAQSDTQIVQTTLGGSGNWDVAWLTLNVSNPDQLVPFLSGPSPTKGNNFGMINNPTYQAGIAKAGKLQGTKGCPDWLAAESALVKNADVIPFANKVISTFGKGAQFASGSTAVVPTTIRMQAG